MLTWDITRCAETERLQASERERVITQALVFATMSVGIGEITADNAPEFFARVKVVEKLSGFLCYLAGEDYGIDFVDVRDRIGLHTNVSQETRAAWLKRYVGYELDDDAGRYKRDSEKVTAAA